jgi:hypothetical protein
MTSHGFIQNEISQEQTMHGNQYFQNKLLYGFRSSFACDNKNFNDSATLKLYAIENS